MDWTQIIIALLGGTTVGGIYEAIRWRKENKRLKEAETSQAETETQRQRINLADDYTKKVLELTELTYQAAMKGNGNQDKMMEKLERLSEQTDKQEGLLTDIVTYLNGDFQNFLRNNHRKENKE